jgi:FtsP/CotA-like multicopper oxidase with cupredoxin domain
MRLAFAGIAVAILILAIVILSGGGNDSNDEKPAAQATATQTAAAPTATATAGETATPEATETPTPTPTVDPGPVLTGAKVVKIEVDKGDTVRFRILSPKDDEVHVHGYDLKKDVKANQPASMSFKATIDGIFDIEFENEGKQIASLRVNP